MGDKISLTYHNFPELLNALQMSCWKHLAEPVTRWKAKQSEAGLVNPPILGPLVVFGEADGEPIEGRHSVAQVIFNRAVRRHGACIDLALLQPKQFTCLSHGDPSLWRVNNVSTQRVKEVTLEFQEALAVFEKGGSLSQVTSAIIYMTADCLTRIALSWARGSDVWDLHKMKPLGQIGRHVFFDED